MVRFTIKIKDNEEKQFLEDFLDDNGIDYSTSGEVEDDEDEI